MNFEHAHKNSINRSFESRIKKILILSMFLFMTFYGFYNARGMIIGPTLDIYSPSSENLETIDKIINVKGEAKNISSITLNERRIMVDTEGFFEEKVLLSPGSNIVEITAKDRFKNEVKKVIKVYYIEQGNYKEEI